MASSEKRTVFAIDLEGNIETAAIDDANALEKLRGSVQHGMQSLKQMGETLRSLRGNTAEVTAQKEELKAKIEAVRSVISASNVELLKQGTSYAKLADAAKKYEQAQAKLQAKKEAEDLAKLKSQTEALGRGVKAVGGPVNELRERFRGLKDVLGEAGAGMVIVGVSAAAVVLGIGAMTAGIIAATVAFAKFVVEGADAWRTANLFREASTGSAESATHLANQIEQLRGVIPTTRDELNKLANETTLALSGTRVSGQGIVDTFNAVAQAAAAGSQAAASAVKSIVDRGKTLGRVGVGMFELQGTGISFEGVAKNLSKNLKIGLGQARQALLYGTVGVDDAAKALRQTVEDRFGSINARQVLGIGVQLQKFRENLQSLTRGVNLDPLLEQIRGFFDLFDANKTVTGATLKQIVEILGNGMVGAASKGGPVVQQLFKRLVIGILDALIAFYKLRKAFKDNESTLEKVKVGAIAFATGLGLIAAAVGVVTAAFVGMGVAAVAAIGELFALPGQVARALGAEQIGQALRAWVIVAETSAESFITGLIDGIKGGFSRVKASVTNLATEAKDAFKNALGIHSPSTVFAQYGAQTSEGYAQGLEGGAGRAQDAAGAMAPAPPRAARGGASKGAGGPVQLHFHLPQGASGSGAQEAIKVLSSPSFIALLTKAIEDANTSLGIPMQEAPAS